MKAATSATPLAAIDAVALDTETTGLRPSSARIVEVAAVPVLDASAAGFSLLVNPAVAIPATSTDVHGIADAMVADAPRFMEAWPQMERFIGDRVVIGYSIGFDLAVLEKEAARAGMRWRRPRSLCVRLLANYANAHLPDYSLDTIASWLGVVVEERHRALGDARTAAGIFRALLPILAGRDVRTLAEAETACMSLSTELETQHRAGWIEPATRPAETSDARVLRAIDPYAYSHRVADIMSSPPLVVTDDTDVAAAVERMMDHQVSSLLVSADGHPGAPVEEYAIVTERDVMRQLAALGPSVLREPLRRFATRPLRSIRAGAFVYRAIGRMDRLRIRHLAVRDEAGMLVGMVSARDLLRLRATAAINLDDAIEAAASPAEMAAAWATLPTVAEALIAEGVDARMIAGVVSEELRIMTRRAAQLAEAEMSAAGLGDPPSPYAVLALGSGGRGESLLAADQDNAVVFASGDPDGPEDAWFASFGERMAAILDAAGIPFCKGGVMASNAQWRGSTETWRRRIAEWVGRSRPEDVLNVDIFFDLAPVHGNLNLGRQLLDFAHLEARAQPMFAKLLGERVGGTDTAFTLFGGLKTHDGRIDLKKFGLFPIVATARTLAIQHDIRAVSTAARLDALIEMNIGGEADLRGLRDAHGLIMSLMLAQQSRDLNSGVPVSNMVDTGRLTREETSMLKAALRRTALASQLIRDLMFA